MLISKGVENIKDAQLKHQSETVFMNQLRLSFDGMGWFTWRINDVKDTGMRVSDLFLNVKGCIFYVETKITSLTKPEVLASNQEVWATPGQRIHNQLVQRNNAPFIYVIRSIKCSEPLTLLYECDKINIVKGLLPTVAMTVPELKQFFLLQASHLPPYKQTLEGLLK